MNAASPMRQPQSTEFRFPEGIEPARQEDLRLVTGTGLCPLPNANPPGAQARCLRESGTQCFAAVSLG